MNYGTRADLERFFQDEINRTGDVSRGRTGKEVLDFYADVGRPVLPAEIQAELQRAVSKGNATARQRLTPKPPARG